GVIVAIEPIALATAVYPDTNLIRVSRESVVAMLRRGGEHDLVHALGRLEPPEQHSDHWRTRQRLHDFVGEACRTHSGLYDRDSLHVCVQREGLMRSRSSLMRKSGGLGTDVRALEMIC